MADSAQRTEQPTARRREKARKEGQFAVSREFVAAVQFAVFVAILGVFGVEALSGLVRLARRLIEDAFSQRPLTPMECRRLFGLVAQGAFLPLLGAGTGLVGATAATHLAVTRLGFAPKYLVPDLSRLNPLKKIKEVWRQNVPQFLQAVVLLPIFGAVVWLAGATHAPAFLRLPFQSLPAGLRVVAGSIDGLLWKAAAAILLWGMVDLARQKRRFHHDLRMTKQEVRDEAKEAQGDPQIRARVRRLMRDLLRRRMMHQVPKATAVVVNPTHYAVALRYQLESMAAPVVVAKGKNYLALRIRALAIEHQVPIVENPPLAQTLYQGVEVGQEIPAGLYRAVAEILAYIFRLRGKK
ncbi:MAG: EscU/YscU/HrcU family type III secretion system export apparatus switch protein [Acidobacteria bacterium]|nr:EscU/YscU/HrcU family type III secretion system export apparatus switch protein [Acidobacteriota bacterium]MBI3471171.1 EscU/YscU/HrcU family type III secretion system export apparatus switch protein [Candidatus Solibacter usitatus]